MEWHPEAALTLSSGWDSNRVQCFVLPRVTIPAGRPLVALASALGYIPSVGFILTAHGSMVAVVKELKKLD